MNLFIEYSLVGLAAGGMYALMALGFVLVFKGTGVFNFAQGELMMLGAYVFLTVNQLAGLHWSIALAATAVFALAAGAFVERAILRALAGQPLLSVVMATVGLGLVLKGAVGLIWGQEQRTLPGLLPRAPVFIGEFLIPGNAFWSFVISMAVVGACLAWFRFTRSGVAMRAAASSQVNAYAVGINVPRISALTWGLAAAVGGFAGVLLAAINNLTPHLGDLALSVLAVLIVGGLDSLAGVIVGGLVIGWLQSMTGAYLGGQYREVMPFVVVLAVLLVRPHGLFGRKEIERI
ncbi:MAG: branched-chain amino acid ABC transporter permease [Burkholderiales bacterium]|nr:branched-chain amino acid ABC transporter permease [Burkholderiales bacterium]